MSWYEVTITFEAKSYEEANQLFEDMNDVVCGIKGEHHECRREWVGGMKDVTEEMGAEE